MLKLFGVFIERVQRIELLVQRLDIIGVFTLAHSHPIADEELEKVVEKPRHLAGELLVFVPCHAVFLANLVFKLALDKVVYELGAVHLAAVFIDLPDNILFNHHD